MRIIYNRFIPFGAYHGLNLFGIIFVQRRWGRMLPYELNHEFIHTLQQWEMAFIGFYLWYIVEFLIRLCICRFDTDRAYRSISLEREAFRYEHCPDYWRHRPLYAWTKLLKERKKRKKSKKDA